MFLVIKNSKAIHLLIDVCSFLSFCLLSSNLNLCFQVDNLWSWASIVLRKHLNNISVETLDDWGQLFTLICVSLK